MRAATLLAELINKLRADPMADVGEESGKLLELAVNRERELEELLALVLFSSGTPVYQLERGDLAECAEVLGAHPGVMVERWPNGYVPPNRTIGRPPIVMQLTLLNSREKELRRAGQPREK